MAAPSTRPAGVTSLCTAGVTCITAHHHPPCRSLPTSLPRGTDWLIMENNPRLTQLKGGGEYLNNIHYLDLRNNSIKSIPDDFIKQLQENRTRGSLWLDLADNELTSVPKEFSEMTSLQKLWLSGNPFQCDCTMTWMITWLRNMTSTPSGERTVVDSDRVTCHSGARMHGRPVYTLSEVEMGCYPSSWAAWQKGVVGVVIAVLLIVVVVLSLIVIRRSRAHGAFACSELYLMRKMTSREMTSMTEFEL